MKESCEINLQELCLNHKIGKYPKGDFNCSKTDDY